MTDPSAGGNEESTKGINSIGALRAVQAAHKAGPDTPTNFLVLRYTTGALESGKQYGVNAYSGSPWPLFFPLLQHCSPAMSAVAISYCYPVLLQCA